MSNYAHSERTPVLAYASDEQMAKLREVSEAVNEPLDTLVVRLAVLAIDFKDMAERSKEAIGFANILMKQHAQMIGALQKVETWVQAEAEEIGTREDRAALADEALAAIAKASTEYMGGAL